MSCFCVYFPRVRSKIIFVAHKYTIYRAESINWHFAESIAGRMVKTMVISLYHLHSMKYIFTVLSYNPQRSMEVFCGNNWSYCLLYITNICYVNKYLKTIVHCVRTGRKKKCLVIIMESMYV